MVSPFQILLSEQPAPVVQKIEMPLTSGRYRVGEPKRPAIVHDNGFLDRYPRREPTGEDRRSFATWVAILEGSEAVCNAQTGDMVGPCGGNLVDANAAYRHFLFGKGADRHLDYERFIEGDPTGRRLLESLIADFKTHGTVLSKNRKKVSITSDPYQVGGEKGFVGYPETANWQKALGAHVLWVSGTIEVSVSKDHKLMYRAEMVAHVEDRYNFNPGNADVKTGIKDEENGQFELCGLAQQYTNFGELRRTLEWHEGDTYAVQTNERSGRTRMPNDNRRLRNRL
ncbi:MAG: hypothetical protein QM742_12055 [Aquabacterium sp.]